MHHGNGCVGGLRRWLNPPYDLYEKNKFIKKNNSPKHRHPELVSGSLEVVRGACRTRSRNKFGMTGRKDFLTRKRGRKPSFFPHPYGGSGRVAVDGGRPF